MQLSKICTRSVKHCHHSTSVLEASQLMSHHHVGAIVIVSDESKDKLMPVGIVTDRDLVIKIIAKNNDPHTVTVGDVMSKELIVASETEEIFEILYRMRLNGIRRMPIVNSQGYLTGIVTLDDIVKCLANIFVESALISQRQRSMEMKLSG